MKQRNYKEYDLTGCALIGSGAKGRVYRYDDELIVKVFHESESLADIEEEVKISRAAFIAGIPTAISFGIGKVGDRYAAVYELLDSDSLSEKLSCYPDQYKEYAGMLADIAGTIHRTEGQDMGLPDHLDVVHSWIDTGLSYADPALEKRVRNLVDQLPAVSTLIHGDLHAGNIICTKREPLLIDMGTLAVGHPIIELSNLYMFYVGLGEIRPQVIEDYMKIPYSLSKDYFRSVLSAYLKTDDRTVLDEAEDKAAVLAYTRMLRWVYKKGPEFSEDERRRKEYYLQRLWELTEKTDTLEFR